ncbi:MAG: hypothetical protein WAM24_01250 [Ignavibacteriaceae bacterium]
MPKNFFILKKISIKNFFFICMLISSCVYSQTRDNLEIFYTLVDSSGENLIKNLPDSYIEVNLNLNLGRSYTLFENHLIAVFSESGYNVNAKDTIGKKIYINYVLDKAKVNYGEMFRSGFFGSYFLPRKLEISGNYSIKNNSFVYKEFQYKYIDTVRADNVKTLENSSYSFTQGNIPPEPFFSSLFEPLIAVGTAAIAVFLFFTIRSK